LPNSGDLDLYFSRTSRAPKTEERSQGMLKMKNLLESINFLWEIHKTEISKTNLQSFLQEL
jgi:hypothetical protein